MALPNSTPYQASNAYWSERQAVVHPACFVTPQNTADVATAVKILTKLQERFAVKGGGHAAFPGASNVDKGVTIDLRHLNDIKVSTDRKTVSVGPGNRWVDVSNVLDPLGLAVVGGRVSDVGVGGLILGGGISFFSGKRGWACDNVRNFEIVLSSGKIVNASPTVNKDLFWALRGGAGTNFGVVTRFDLASFDQGNMWYRSLILPGALNATVIDLFQNFAVNGLTADPDAHSWFLLAHVPSFGGYIVLNDQFHPTPPPQNTVPPVFTPFNSLPTIVSTTVVSNISAIVSTNNSPYGAQQIWMNTAVSATSPTLFKEIVPLFEAYVSTIVAKSNGSEITPALILQPIGTKALSAMQVNGGNALGLTPSDGPLMIVQLSVTWADGGLNAVVEKETKALLEKIKSLAKKKGADNGYVYMNYAEPSQDVFGSYGKASLDRLRRVAKQYDPEGALAKLWKGYFKLN